LATNDQATTQVRAIASQTAGTLKEWMLHNKLSIVDTSEQAHVLFAIKQVEQYQKDPKKLDLTTPSEPPDGPPIGDDEDFSGWPLN